SGAERDRGVGRAGPVLLVGRYKYRMPELSQTGFVATFRSSSLACDLGLVAAGTLITAACAQVSVPWQPVPFTLQTLGVTLCGLRLGARRAAASQVAYVAAGAAGA